MIRIWLAGLLAAALGGGCASVSDVSQPKPNLVILLADDLGYADVGFQGATDIRTPHIDRIAREGVRFTDGYVTGAVCGPSRAGLITGRYQDRFGSGINPTVDPSMPNGVPRSERMISELLGPAGYRSMAVGKWHLGTHPGLHPRDRGFDEFYGFLTGGHDYFPERLTLEDLSEVRFRWDWYRTKLLHNGVRVETDEYLTDELSNAAVEFIDRQTADDPFFLYLAYNAPHTPMQATDAYLSRFPEIKDDRRRTYAAMVSAMDDGVGRVLEALERAGVADNTLVVFLSDNGGAHNNGSSNSPLRGRKSHPWEGGIRVPFAIRWPGVIEPGTTYELPISALDIAATIVAAAGSEAQAAVLPDKPLDGVDLRPYLDGSAEGAPHDALLWRWHVRDQFAVRAGDDKLIETTAGSAFDGLFDLANDPAETTDRLPIDEATAERLRAVAIPWIEQLVPPAHPSLGTWKPQRK